MAFRINNPEVGATLLKTFATFAEENRRRQQLDQQANQALQNLAIKEMGVTLRERSLDQQATRNQNTLLLGLLRQGTADAHLELDALETANKLSKDRRIAVAKAKEARLVAEFNAALDIKNEGGKSLTERIHSSDENEAKEAVREAEILVNKFRVSELPGVRLAVKDFESELDEKQRRWFSETREARMKAQAEAAAKKSEQTGQRSLMKDQGAALRRQIKEGEKLYQDLWDAEGVASDEAERKRLKAEKEDAGKKTDALKKRLQELEGELLNPENAPTLEDAAAPSVIPDQGAVTPVPNNPNEMVVVINPQNQPVRIKRSQLASALQSGYKQP